MLTYPRHARPQRAEAEYKKVTDVEKKDVVELGGLHVVGTERHVSHTHRASRVNLSLSGLLCSRSVARVSSQFLCAGWPESAIARPHVLLKSEGSLTGLCLLRDCAPCRWSCWL